jgi:site-specific DNA-methyltransferase (adenine-specific)
MIEIIHTKCEDGILTLTDNTVDLVVTSPPYNVDLGNNKDHNNPYDLYNDNKDHKEYIEWLKGIFSSLYPKMKSGGRIAINIGDGKNGAVPTHSDIIYFMCNELGYIPFSTIIWNKSQIGNRTAWGSWLSPSCPSFPTPFEYVLIFSKEDKKLSTKGESDLHRDEFIKYAFAIWDIAPETRMKDFGHPAMFPEELVARLIKMLCWKEAMVVDPFSGAGTTAVVCKRLGRNFIGFEMSKEYCQKSIERVKNQKPLDELDLFS